MPTFQYANECNRPFAPLNPGGNFAREATFFSGDSHEPCGLSGRITGLRCGLRIAVGTPIAERPPNAVA
jgi:hypothetical protein